MVEKETADKLMSNDGSLSFGAGTAHFRELIPRPKKGTAGKSDEVEIRLDDGTTDAEVDTLDKLTVNLSLEEAEQKHTDETKVESAGTSETPKPINLSTGTSQKVQFTIRGTGKKITSTVTSEKKEKIVKQNDGTKSSAESEKDECLISKPHSLSSKFHIHKWL